MSDNKAIMSIRDQIKKQAAALNESLAVKAISVNKKGNFQIGAIESTSDTMQVVILAFSYSKAYWEKSFSAGNSSVPDCTAQGDVDTYYAEKAALPVVASFLDLVPNAPAEDKEVQSESCGECPLNEFGTGQGGKGKACKDAVVLAVLPANDPKGHIHTVRISASGIKHFRDFLKTLGTAGTTWFAVAATLKAIDAGAQYTVKVLNGKEEIMPLADAQLTEFYGRVEEAKKIVGPRPAKPAEAAA